VVLPPSLPVVKGGKEFMFCRLGARGRERGESGGIYQRRSGTIRRTRWVKGESGRGKKDDSVNSKLAI
jgi:hypothetical protein